MNELAQKYIQKLVSQKTDMSGKGYALDAVLPFRKGGIMRQGVFQETLAKVPLDDFSQIFLIYLAQAEFQPHFYQKLLQSTLVLVVL